MLETLFIKLDRPAKTIKFEGLHENVVPLVKNSRSIQCLCPSDVTLTISHSQISVLPNFAMTDYASQGKTHPFNIVDLNSCCNHLSYYTALSRSAACEGTVIVQGFDPSKVTCGASGFFNKSLGNLSFLMISPGIDTIPNYLNQSMGISAILFYISINSSKGRGIVHNM